MFRAIVSAVAIAVLVSSASAQWFQQASNTTWPLFGVDASNPRTATAVGDVSTILRTTDAGQTWTPQTGENGQVFACVSFADDSNGVIGGPNGLTVYTHNAGALWETAHVGGIIWYFAAHQLSPDWAIVGGSDMNGVAIVSVTTNGWQTFSEHAFFPQHNDSGYTSGIFGIHFITAEIGFAAMAIDNGEGAICRTTDAGVTWETVHWNANALYAIDFANADTGCVVGANGTIVHTFRGGVDSTDWSVRDSPTTQTLTGVSYGSTRHVWAVGVSGTILHSPMAGEMDWEVQDSPVTEDLYAVSFASADTGYAVGNNGVIIFTANGGAPANQPPGAFWRVSPQDSVVVDTSELVMEVPLVWTTSVDPDGDAVSYTVHFWSNDWDCIVENNFSTWDTTVTAQVCVPVSPLDELYHFHWRVFARDGQDSVEASNGEGMFLLDLPENTEGPGSDLPREFALSAYPNPFNPTTTLRVSLPVSSEAILRVFDVTGRLAKEIRLGMLTSGSHEIAFDGSDLPSGIYIAAVETPMARKTQKLILLK